MNSFIGEISNLETQGKLTLVTVKVASDTLLEAIIIDTPETANYLRSGNRVQVLFKETEVIISLQPGPKLSINNKIPCRIALMETGKLLARLELTSALGSIGGVIPASAIEQLQLKEGQDVYALIKFNEIMLAAE